MAKSRLSEILVKVNIDAMPDRKSKPVSCKKIASSHSSTNGFI